MKLATIIKKEYREIVRKKAFIISTLLTPLLMALFIFLPMLLFKISKGEKTVYVADYSHFVFDQLTLASPPGRAPERAAQPGRLPEWDEPAMAITFKRVPLAGRAPDELQAEFEGQILKQKTDGFLIIPADIAQSRKVRYYAANISDFGTNKFIGAAIRTIVSRHILLERQISPATVDEATRDVELVTFKVKKEGTTQTSSGLDYLLSIFMLTVLFSIIIGYGQLIMRGVSEEKNSRIVEILISSTRTSRLFYGKIVGIGLAGLTQVGIWMLFGVAVLGRFAGGIERDILGFITAEIALYFLLYFLCGYFIYAILFAIVGAAVNTDQEAQQYAAPIVYLLLVPFFIGMMVTQNPSSPVAVIASFFPLFTPILMFMRITVQNPGPLQIALALALCAATILVLAWLGAKIFRVGILMFGKKPTLKEICRWARHR